MAGIYKLTAPNGKCYIGQSIDLDRRLRDYANRVVKGQRHLHRAVKKYGWDNFKVEILWRTKHPERYRNLNVLLDTLEIAWIKKFDSVANGYNLQYGGSNGLHSEESKQRMSAARAGKTLSEEHRRKISAALRGIKVEDSTRWKRSKKVKQYDVEGRLIREWPSIQDAADFLGVTRPSISSVCRKINSMSAGFRWAYATDQLAELKNKRQYLAVEQYTQEGKLVKTWESAKEAGREIGVDRGSIHQVCRGKRRSAGGFKWKYAK